jgi:hypothetical protein
MVMDQPRFAGTRRAANETQAGTQAGPQSGLTEEFGQDAPLMLDCGVGLGPFTLAYQTYGRLNAARSNAILVCHALTGDQYVAGVHPVTGKPGWWSDMVGPGLPLDTERYFVLCVNVLGGCMGSTGPKSVNPASGEPWALDFPVITVSRELRPHDTIAPPGRLRIARRFPAVRYDQWSARTGNAWPTSPASRRSRRWSCATSPPAANNGSRWGRSRNRSSLHRHLSLRVHSLPE